MKADSVYPKQSSVFKILHLLNSEQLGLSVFLNMGNHYQRENLQGGFSQQCSGFI